MNSGLIYTASVPVTLRVNTQLDLFMFLVHVIHENIIWLSVGLEQQGISIGSSQIFDLTPPLS